MKKRVSLPIAIFALTIIVLVTIAVTAQSSSLNPEENKPKLIGTKLSDNHEPSCFSDDESGNTYCRWVYQDNTNPTTFSYVPGDNSHDDLYIYKPGLGDAAVKVIVQEPSGYSWSITMDQSSNIPNWNSIRRLYDVPDSDAMISFSNACVSGYWCGGLKVYFDDTVWTIYP